MDDGLRTVLRLVVEDAVLFREDSSRVAAAAFARIDQVRNRPEPPG